MIARVFWLLDWLFSVVHPCNVASSTDRKTPVLMCLIKPYHEGAADIWKIFNTPGRVSVETFQEKAITKQERSPSKIALYLETNIPEGLTILAFPASCRCLIRTTNGLEQISGEVNHPTRLVGIFLDEAAYLSLVSAI
jgi:hypothetical protein